MKKFDLLLIIVACGLISFGFYFSKRFKHERTDKEYSSTLKRDKASVESLSKDKKAHEFDEKTSRQPSQDSKANTEKDFIDKYVELRNCIKSQDCDFSQEDPRSYELAVYDSIKDHLGRVDALSNSLRERVLISAASLPNGHVKELVLAKAIEQKLYSEKWRDTVLNEYVSFHDSKLIPQVIEYFKANSSKADLGLIHERFFQEISNGSPKVANALAENVKQLLDENSLSYYKSKISNLQEGPIKRNLNRELVDYEMITSAG